MAKKMTKNTPGNTPETQGTPEETNSHPAQNSSSENIIEIENVVKEYGEKLKTRVLKGITLSVRKGSFISIIGQSGSGKTTLLNILGTLDRPTSGKVKIDGVETTSLSEQALAKLRNRTIGFIFQFHYLLPEFTALENVMMPYYIYKSSSPPAALSVPEEKPEEDFIKVKQRAIKILEMVGVGNEKDKKADQMSGGQQQRVSIARALINRPKIVLADEPTGNLDSDSGEEVFKLMRSINRKFNTTFVIVTHDRRIADRTNRIVEIKDGKIEMDILVS